MRKIYILVAVFFVSSIIIFLASFVYLDKTRHVVYYYVVNLEGHDIGTVRTDKFDTEDKMVYKSAASIPLSALFTEYKARLDLDKKYAIEEYTKERTASGVSELNYLENNDGRVSFVNRFQARFAYLENIPIQKDTLVFEEDSPVTYLPILENYNFKRGRSQGFNAITFFQDPNLPPMKRFVTFTSVKDGYIKIDSRKIKAENLLLKIRNYPQGSIWVSKSDKSLLELEIPQRGLRITRTFSPKELPPAKKHILNGDGYISKDVSFKNKNIELAGTLTIPKKEGNFPAVLLVCGDGPHDRDYQGLFSSLSDYLSGNGFCVLRLDKRGVGSSGGEYASYTHADEAEDMDKALEYLSGQKEVDKQKMVVISHSEGAYYALKAAAATNRVNAIILMAPSIWLESWSAEKTEAFKELASKAKWTEEYLKLADRSIAQAEARVMGSRSNWTRILGNRVFLKKIREELSEKPVELIKNIKAPVLILQGKEDEESPMEIAPKLDKALADSGNAGHTLTYYGYLGHFLGKAVNDGNSRIHYEIDKEVAENIKNWLNTALNPPAVVKPDTN